MTMCADRRYAVVWGRARRWLLTRQRELIASSSRRSAVIWGGCAATFFFLSVVRMWSSGKWLLPSATDDLLGFLGVGAALVLAAGVTWFAIGRAVDDWRRNGQKT